LEQKIVVDGFDALALRPAVFSRNKIRSLAGQSAVSLQSTDFTSFDDELTIAVVVRPLFLLRVRAFVSHMLQFQPSRFFHLI